MHIAQGARKAGGLDVKVRCEGDIVLEDQDTFPTATRRQRDSLAVRQRTASASGPGPVPLPALKKRGAPVAVQCGAANRGQALQMPFVDVTTRFAKQGLPAVRAVVEVDHQDALRKCERRAFAKLGGERRACRSSRRGRVGGLGIRHASEFPVVC